MPKSVTGPRIAVVGASPRGLALAGLLVKHADAMTVGAADPSEAALAQARARLGDEGVYYASSDRELYEQCECDAVVIASGDPYHVDNLEVALQCGKDVFLEKPIAQTMDGLKRLVDAWRKSDRVVMVGLELRQCVLFQKMRRLLDEGAIGRILIAQAFDNVSVGGRYYYHNHYRSRDYVRSLLLQKGTHTIDLVNWFVGARPTRAFCLAGQNVFGLTESEEKRCRDCPDTTTCPHVVKDHEIVMDYGATQKMDDTCVYAKAANIDDNSLVLIDYDNHTRAFYGECHFTPEYTREFTLIGSEGKMTGFYNNECEFKITVTRAESPRETRVFRPRPVMAGGHGGSDNLAMIEFARRIRERDRAEKEFWEIVDGAAIAVAATDSSETGQPADIPQFRC